MSLLPTAADIAAAASRIAPYAVVTPLIESAELNERVGGRVLIKLETLQRTGSFKFRGACNRIALIPEEGRAPGIVAFSSGNHAQGVAAAAALFAMKAVIVMPADAPRAKIDGTRAHGADIVFYDRARKDREAIALEICERTGATLIRPFDDAGIIAGQGTVGLEIAHQAREARLALDGVLVPCGGGGLVSGTALALRGEGSNAVVTSVEPENFDGMRRSLLEGARVAAPAAPATRADALMSPAPGELPFALARRLLGPGLAVTDAELDAAVSYAARRLKLVVEPGGAAALAAVLAGKAATENRRIAIVLSGGNADFETIAGACARAPALYHEWHKGFPRRRRRLQPCLNRARAWHGLLGK